MSVASQTGAESNVPTGTSKRDLTSQFADSTGTLTGDKSLLTARDVAALLGVRESWVYEQSRAGRIPTVTLGRYRRYRREAIEEWLKERESPARGVSRL